jgi:hypothetical protein
MSQYNLNNNQTINNIPSGDNTLNNLNLNTYTNQNLENNQSTTDLNNKDLPLYERAHNLHELYKNQFTVDPLKDIENCENAIIDQPITYLQLASGCITENEFSVYLDTPRGLLYTFYFKEKSNCLCRNCCKQAKRPFDMWASYVPSAKEIEHKVERHYFYIDRPCGCNHYCCFCNCIRPKMKVSYAKTGKYLGTIIDSCDCCNKKLEIYDDTEQLIYEIETSCCQIGLCFDRNAETVAKIDFKIYNSGEKVGHIIKVPSLADKLARIQVDSYHGFHDASNNFIVNFPENATPEHKFLLIIAAIKLGYQFFTENRAEYNFWNRCCGNACNYCCFPCRYLFWSNCSPFCMPCFLCCY